MKKKIFRKIRNFILKAFTFFMIILCALSIVSLDSDSWLPLITLAISVGYLWLVMWANFKKWEGDKNDLDK